MNENFINYHHMDYVDDILLIVRGQHLGVLFDEIS